MERRLVRSARGRERHHSRSALLCAVSRGVHVLIAITSRTVVVALFVLVSCNGILLGSWYIANS